LNTHTHLYWSLLLLPLLDSMPLPIAAYNTL